MMGGRTTAAKAGKPLCLVKKDCVSLCVAWWGGGPSFFCKWTGSHWKGGLCVLGRRLPSKEYSRLVFPLLFKEGLCESVSGSGGQMALPSFHKGTGYPFRGGGRSFLFALGRCLAMAEYSGFVFMEGGSCCLTVISSTNFLPL